jgi:trehalose 6-phosphate phosphatase
MPRNDRNNDFFHALARAPHALLLLDYDGTLAPFRIDRFQARPYARIRDLLARIQSQQKTRMAIITGRPAHEVAPLLGLDPPLEVWGLHGAERLYPDGRRELEDAPPATRAKLNELREYLKHDSLGGLYEDKPNAAVMHWRGLAPGKARQVEQRARALFAPLSHLEGLTLLDFLSGVELRVGRDKGGAVEAIIREETRAHAASVPVAFLGDDLTDEAAFRAVNNAAAPHLSVLVRRTPRDTAADLRLKPPVEVREFLDRWFTALNGERKSASKNLITGN